MLGMTRTNGLECKKVVWEDCHIESCHYALCAGLLLEKDYHSCGGLRIGSEFKGKATNATSNKGIATSNKGITTRARSY